MLKFLFSLLLLSLSACTTVTPLARQPQSLPQQEKEYFLLDGTQSCPANISIKKSCRGWILKDDQQISHSFCNANIETPQKKSRESFGMKTVSSKTEYTDSYVKSLITTVMTGNEGQVVLEEENTLFWSQEGNVLWENRKSANGMSCLYSESDFTTGDSLISSI